MQYTRFTCYIWYEPHSSNNEIDPQSFFSDNVDLMIQESEKSFCNPQSTFISDNATKALNEYFISQKSVHPGFIGDELTVVAIDGSGDDTNY